MTCLTQNCFYKLLLQNADYGPQLVRQSVELDQESLAATESIAAELTTDHHQVTQEIQAGLFHGEVYHLKLNPVSFPMFSSEIVME